MNENKLDKESLLKKFNTTDELICYLNELVDCEMEKPEDEMDCDMIHECDKWTLELQGIDIKQIELSKKEIKKRVQLLSDKHYNPIKPKKRFRFRYVAVMLSFALIAWISIETISIAAFHNNFFDGIPNLSKYVARFLRGNPAEQNEQSIVSSRVREYKTIEQFIKREKVNIAVPGWLPDIKIKYISYSYDLEKKRIEIYYDDEITYLSILLDSSMVGDTDNAQMIYENDGIEYYIYSDIKNTVYWEYGNASYILFCGFDFNEYAEKIIKNIK